MNAGVCIIALYTASFRLSLSDCFENALFVSLPEEEILKEITHMVQVLMAVLYPMDIMTTELLR